jgi:hypothetical protein
MIRKIFFLIASVSLVSCSQYSGPDYYTAGPDMKPNLGGYDEETYSEDISKLSFIMGKSQHIGNAPAKATRKVIDGKTVVDLAYEFPRGDKTYSFYMTIPDYQGIGMYNDTSKAVSITFHKKKAFPEEVPDTVWRSDGRILVEVVKADDKYIDVKFEGLFGAINSVPELLTVQYVAAGEIRNQWLR